MYFAKSAEDFLKRERESKQGRKQKKRKCGKKLKVENMAGSFSSPSVPLGDIENTPEIEKVLLEFGKSGMKRQNVQVMISESGKRT